MEPEGLTQLVNVSRDADRLGCGVPLGSSVLVENIRISFLLNFCICYCSSPASVTVWETLVLIFLCVSV